MDDFLSEVIRLFADSNFTRDFEKPDSLMEKLTISLSLALALKMKIHVALPYLTLPHITDQDLKCSLAALEDPLFA